MFGLCKSNAAVTNNFINRANIGDKKSWQAYFGLENKNMTRIALLKHIKRPKFVQKTFCKGALGILEYLGGQKNAWSTRLGRACLMDKA